MNKPKLIQIPGRGFALAAEPSPNEPPMRDYYQEKLDRWKEEWNRELDEDLEKGR